MRFKFLVLLAFLLCGFSAHDAWAATRTISVAGGNWSATTAWAEAIVPTDADDVVATGLSGNLTIDGVAGTPSLARSVDLTGYVGTLTQASSKELDVGTSTSGNFKLPATGMTYAPSTASLIKFVSTTTGNTITTGGRSLGPVTFDGVGGAWSLADAFTSSRDITITNGAVTATSTISGRSFLPTGGTFNCGGTATFTSTSTVSGGTVNCASNTFNGTGLTITAGTANIGTWAGTGALSVSGTGVGNLGASTFTSGAISAGTVTMSGDLTFNAGGLNVSLTGNFDDTGHNLTTSSSVIMSSSGVFKVAAIAATTTCTFSAGTTTITGNVACTTFTTSGSTVRVVNLGNGTYTLSGTGVVFSVGNTPTNLTFNAQGSTIIFSDTSASAKSASVGTGLTFNNFQVNGAAGGGAFTFTSGGTGATYTFNTFTAQPDSSIIFINTNTFVASSWVMSGTSGHVVTINSSSAGSNQATISQATGTLGFDYMSIKNIGTTGGAAWYAGANSTDVSGNTGFIFAGKPASGQHFSTTGE